MMLRKLKRTIRQWLECPVDGAALLKEAHEANLGGTTALIFERKLSGREIAAIERAWQARPYDPPVPPFRDTDPGQR